MARRRLQQKGDLYQQGGWWKLRWREDQRTAGEMIKRAWSRTVFIGPAEGSTRLTEKEARRIAWENFLSRLDQNNRVPQSVITLGEFVERKFLPEHVMLKKRAGQNHYHYMLKHVLPDLGDLRLRDISQDDVQRLVSAEIARGKSVQTAKHVRNVVSAIFRHAKRKGWHAGDNPASGVELPEMVRRERHALTLVQFNELLLILPSPTRELSLVAVLTSMNIAEICGLLWKHLNLGPDWAILDGEGLPPMTLAVRQQWYRGAYGSVKARSRRRNIPIPSLLAEAFVRMRQRLLWTAPDDPVFAARTGNPIDEHNCARRQLKPAGRKLGMPWLSWHAFRRTHTVLADQMGMQFQDRMMMLGHADARMTLHYTLDDLDRRRKILDAMASRICSSTEGFVQ